MFRRRLFFHRHLRGGCFGCGAGLFAFLFFTALIVFFLIWFFSHVIH